MKNQTEYFLAIQNRQVEESAEAVFKMLLEFFQIHANTEASYQKAIFDTVFFLCRPGWLGEKLDSNAKKKAQEMLLLLGKPIFYAKDADTLSQFAQIAANTIASLGPRPQESQKDNAAFLPEIGNIREIVETELSITGDSKTAVARAAMRMYRSSQEQKRQFSVPNLSAKDPLRTVLGLPQTKRTTLPNWDPRTHLLKSTRSKKNNEVPLVDLLKRAAPFSPRVLQSVLGVETYEKFRPVGYFDQQCQIILIETRSASDAYELPYRKQELLRLLRTVPGFENISDIRSTVASKKTK